MTRGWDGRLVVPGETSPSASSRRKRSVSVFVDGAKPPTQLAEAGGAVDVQSVKKQQGPGTGQDAHEPGERLVLGVHGVLRSAHTFRPKVTVY